MGGDDDLRRSIRTLQVAFTYMGTVVGAGFATGQEILQFFTRFGHLASLTILLTTVFICWLGTKIMLIAQDIGATSYEDLNRHLFGEQAGRWISLLSMLNLFSVSAVMLAGAGSVFQEQFGIAYNTGLALTMGVAFLLLLRGITSIMAVNSLVVPFMLTYTVLVVIITAKQPMSGNWLTLASVESPLKMVSYAFMYIAGNLALAQAVLVPIGSNTKDRTVLYRGGIIGGCGIGFMLLAGHFALSAHMPGVMRYEIPMGYTVSVLGSTVQILIVTVIFAEIFTTLLSNVYGLSLQIQRYILWRRPVLIAVILITCCAISQVGFSRLLSFLYPLFGLISLVWLAGIFMSKPPLPRSVRD